MREEESLIQRAKERDPVALTQIYEDNFDRIYRYIVLKIGDRTEAEDMTQQVFLNVIKAIPGYKSKGMPLSSWLYRIAHNQVVDYFRKKSKKQFVPLDERIESGDDDPLRETEKKMQVEELSQATKQLTKAQQEVISLRFAGELSIAEVAKMMGKSTGAVKALQHSAIVALRRVMAPGTIQ